MIAPDHARIRRIHTRTHFITKLPTIYTTSPPPYTEYYTICRGFIFQLETLATCAPPIIHASVACSNIALYAQLSSMLSHAGLIPDPFGVCVCAIHTNNGAYVAQHASQNIWCDVYNGLHNRACIPHFCLEYKQFVADFSGGRSCAFAHDTLLLCSSGTVRTQHASSKLYVAAQRIAAKPFSEHPHPTLVGLVGHREDCPCNNTLAASSLGGGVADRLPSCAGDTRLELRRQAVHHGHNGAVMCCRVRPSGVRVPHYLLCSQRLRAHGSTPRIIMMI